MARGTVVSGTMPMVLHGFNPAQGMGVCVQKTSGFLRVPGTEKPYLTPLPPTKKIKVVPLSVLVRETRGSGERLKNPSMHMAVYNPL